MATHVRWEVWVSDQILLPQSGDWRFNACFERLAQANTEAAWYTKRGYATDVRVRTTRFQRREHITTGADPMANYNPRDDDYNYSDGVLEYPEGSGG